MSQAASGTLKSNATLKKQQAEENARVQAQAQGPKLVPRTLPREILKWIQVLDLSYSVKDTKRDLSNGFLIAEIFQRYYPTKVQMHSFDNSHNLTRKKNNWELLQLFFSKNEIAIERSDWEPILLDSEMDTLINFMSKIFTILTQKKLQKPPLANYINSKEFLTSTQSNNELAIGGTTSYLLKDKGLERLDEKKEEKSLAQADDKEKKLDGSVSSENKGQLTNHSSKRTNFLRVPSKPISQNIESLSHQIDVKNITVRQVQGSILKLRENKMLVNEPGNQELTGAQLQSLVVSKVHNNQINGENTQKSQNQLDTNQQYMSSQDSKKKEKLVEQTILDILNNMLMIRFQQGTHNEELKKIRGKNINLASAFADQVDEFSDEFVSSFLNEILQQKDAFISFLFKETNNLWTFFNFCFTILYNLSHNKQSLHVIGEFIKGFGEKSLQRDPNKTKNIFVEFFLPTLAEKIKQCTFFQKKEIMIQTIYHFCPNDPASKSQMISSVKICLKDMNIFMQVLVILFQFEDSYTEYNKKLIEDFLLFATQNLFAAATNLRTMSLAIYSHAADLKPDVVLNSLINKIDAISKNQWWECKCLAIIVFSKVIKGIINSDRYQSLVKNPSANQKFFSIENERMISEMKEQMDKFARGIYNAAFPPSSAIILSTSFIYIVEHLGESKILLELFLNLILNCSEPTRNWVLHSDEENYKQGDQNTLQTSGFHSQLNMSVDKNNENQANQQHNMRGSGTQGAHHHHDNLLQDEEDKEQIEQLNMLNPSNHLKESDLFQYLIYSSRSLKYKSQINSAVIKTYASQILQLFVQYIKDQDKQLEQLSQEHMDIITFGFKHTDFKIINMESCETIANVLKEYILISLCDSNLCQQGKQILLKLLDLQFFSDVKLADIENLFGSTIGLIYKNQIEDTIHNMEDILQILVDQAFNQGVENVKQFLLDSVHYLKQKKMMQYIQDTKAYQLLEKPIAFLDTSNTQDNNQQQQQKPSQTPSNQNNKNQQQRFDDNTPSSSNHNMHMIQEKPHEKEESIDPFNEDSQFQNRDYQDRNDSSFN
ncbi:calponin-like domain protein (macronuclear) [Tetrahymena thermophila SB210]|uniref:Calponin-like domain protein n=1 Tax=Tetrahymena thermophila (strain SB210) TaxID=312017 RepID=Q22GC7_TETTS|nr:calponin-like domain protein [Tetrahymena thermophila SB210]EAR84404.1 calponin-like domain protein [Tetrahymena thermophila SB210]|eukprot:XP_001032067.1 calponin-like domain protein [Tetrahymena thermophila SB210]